MVWESCLGAKLEMGTRGLGADLRFGRRSTRTDLGRFTGYDQAVWLKSQSPGTRLRVQGVIQKVIESGR